MEPSPSIVTHSLVNTDRITVLTAGTYRITYAFEATPTASSSFESRVRVNDTTVVNGSYSRDNIYTNETDWITNSCIVSLAANDYVCLQVQNTTATGTIYAPMTLIVQKLDGTKGATGSGSSITMQDDGVNVPSTPHSTLNCGTGITCTNAGSGVALVALDAAVPLADNSTQPATPTTGTRLFARFRAGRRMTSQLGPMAHAYEFQPAFFTNNVSMWQALGGSTTPSLWAFTNTVTGTATARAVATTNFFNTMKRLGFVSAASTGSSAGVRHGVAQWYRGNGSGLGGFLYVCRFGLSSATTVANQRWLVGMSATTGALGNANPSTFFNFVGVGQDTGDSSIFAMYNDGSGAATKVDLGVANFPTPTNSVSWYEFRLFVPSNGATFYWSLENLVTGALTEGNTNASANVPSNTTLLGPQVWINNGTTAAAVGIDVGVQYIESDN